jgi:hypothetical protein
MRGTKKLKEGPPGWEVAAGAWAQAVEIKRLKKF